jgi:hypothetical protein
LYASSQPADGCNTKEAKKKLGVLNPGELLQNPLVQLHPPA